MIINYENAVPKPEYLIKSIAEQGYSLETSLSDLIDNSISASASRIEVLIDTEISPFTLFIADNGNGMSEYLLQKCMQFPSSSISSSRDSHDLGRFGLGMKTASFSQTRTFTVISREKGTEQYSGRTWDVDFLAKEGQWRLIINSQEEISALLAQYTSLSKGYNNSFSGFEANTILVWKKLYKFEDYLDPDIVKLALKKQLNEITTEYLSLVFHRFMERKNNPIKIRVNNSIIKPFNPFLAEEQGVRLLESKQREFRDDKVKLEGYILPARAIDETINSISSKWTLKTKSLMDMEGLYIYRADRIILFGGWNGLIRKTPRLQLARLKIDVGNKIDDVLQLNVAKSQIVIPYNLRNGLMKYIQELKNEAENEFNNRKISIISSLKSNVIPQLFEKSITNKGISLELNNRFPLIEELEQTLNEEQYKTFKLLKRMITSAINKVSNLNQEQVLVEEEEFSNLYQDMDIIKNLLNQGLTSEFIKYSILPNIGYNINKLPESITELLEP